VTIVRTAMASKQASAKVCVHMTVERGLTYAVKITTCTAGRTNLTKGLFAISYFPMSLAVNVVP